MDGAWDTVMMQSSNAAFVVDTTPKHMRVTGRVIEEEVTEEAIRSLMERHRIEEMRRAARKAAVVEDDDLEPDDSVVAAVQEIVSETPDETHTAQSGEPSNPRRSLKLPNYEPKWSHTLVVLALTVTLARPLLIPSLVALVIAAIVVSYLSLGHDRSRELLLQAYEWLAERRPERAEELRARLMRMSQKTTGLIEWLPERWTNGLYLPDFEPSGELPEKMREDPFERLQRQIRQDRMTGV